MAPDSHPNWLARETARKRAAALIMQQPLIRGSIISALVTCGNDGCRCIREGTKHPAYYLAIRHQGKRRMFCIPRKLLAQVHKCVKNHQMLEESLEIISRECTDIFFLEKRR